MKNNPLPHLENLIFKYTKGNKELNIFPTFHDDIGFASQVTRVFREERFNIVALELPVQLREQFEIAFNRLPAFTLIHQYPTEDEFKGNMGAYVVQPGDVIYSIAMLARQYNLPIKFIDTLISVDKEESNYLGYYHLASIGWEEFWNGSDQVISNHFASEHIIRTKHMLANIDEISENKPLVVLGAAHWVFIHHYLLRSGFRCDSNIEIDGVGEIFPQIHDNSSSPWYVSEIDAHTLFLTIKTIPYLVAMHVSSMMEDKSMDILDSIRNLFLQAEKVYYEKFDDKISVSSFVKMFQYLRNLSRMQGNIIPHLMDLVQTAKGMGDDDYAYEVFRIAISYPFPSDINLKNTVKFSLDGDAESIHKIVFKRRYKRKILRISDDEYIDFEPFPVEDFPGHWNEIWDKYSDEGYVSYPPEDIFLEGYLRTLERKLSDILRKEESSVIKFETSLEDGIDWRKTIENRHEGTIYVKKNPKQVTRIGAIIVQFVEEPISDDYSHYSTLYAEHDKESHLSIITTEIAKEFVGPGICRVKYAALISQFPPIGIPRRILRTEDDLKLRLIYSAMNMSLSNIIGFISSKPPTSAQREFASSYGFRILYLPIINLSKQSMHRLRTMHLLANISFRDVAREYIGF